MCCLQCNLRLKIKIKNFYLELKTIAEKLNAVLFKLVILGKIKFKNSLIIDKCKTKIKQVNPQNCD